MTSLGSSARSFPEPGLPAARSTAPRRYNTDCTDPYGAHFEVFRSGRWHVTADSFEKAFPYCSYAQWCRFDAPAITARVFLESTPQQCPRIRRSTRFDEAVTEPRHQCT